MAYGAGLVLLGLDMIAIAVVWNAERNAMSTLGRFMHASITSAIARDTGNTPSLIDQRGNVMIVTVLVGTARYTSSSVSSAFIVLAVCLVLGAGAIVLAACPVLAWRRFSLHGISKSRSDSSANAAVSCHETGATSVMTVELSQEESHPFVSMSSIALPAPWQPPMTP